MWVTDPGRAGVFGMLLVPSEETTPVAARSFSGCGVRPRPPSGTGAHRADAATSTATSTPLSSIPTGFRFREDRGAGSLGLLTTEGDGLVRQRPEGVCVVTRDHGQSAILHELLETGDSGLRGGCVEAA